MFPNKAWLHDEGDNEADEGQSLGESSADDEVREQTTLKFGLTGGGDAATIAGNTDADARADGAKAVTDDFESREYEGDIHKFLLLHGSETSSEPLPVFPSRPSGPTK